MQQEVRNALQNQKVRASGGHKNVPHLLPHNAHAHQAPQEIPVAQLLLLPEDGPETADGGLGALRLHPVGEELQNLPLRPLIAPLEHVSALGNPRQPQKVQGLGPLLGAEEVRGGGNVPL